MLSNNPPPAAELFADEIESLKSRAEAFGEITEDNAGDARDLIGLAGKLAKDIDAKRAEEKKPHLDAGREIDGTYNPLKTLAEKATDSLKKALTAFAVEQKRKAQEAERKAREKAEAQAALAAELADDDLLADDAAEAAKQAETEARLVAAEAKMTGTVKGSEGFRAAGLRVTRKAKVIDYDKLVQHYGSHPDMQALAERLANATIRGAKGAPVEIPGVEVEETEVLV